jgi:hypothetical protein
MELGAEIVGLNDVERDHANQVPFWFDRGFQFDRGKIKLL